MANPNADLGALTVRRDAGPELRPPRRWVSRVLVPLALVSGFGALVAWASYDLIVPPTAVRVVAVQVRTGGVAEAVGEELFQANGWIEPRPLPIDVPVQTDGMYRVRDVRVNPGDAVREGQELILLEDTAARLALEAANIRAARQKAAVKSASADAGKADVAWKNAEVAIGLAKAEGDAEVAAQAALVTKAEAQRASAELTLQVEEDLRSSGAVASDVKVRQARQLRDVAVAEVASAMAILAKARTVSTSRVRLAETAKAAAAADSPV